MPPTPPLLREQLLPLPAALRPVVRQLLLLTTAPGAEPVVRTLLPDFQGLLLLNLGPGAELWFATGAALAPVQRLRGALLAGPLTTPLHYRLPGGARVLAVKFTLAGFYRLFQVPAEQLRGQLADPDAVVARGGFAQLQERLQALPNPRQLGAALAAFCRPCLRPLEAPAALLLAQLPLLTQGGPLGSLKQLAAASHLSERTLQLRFRKYLGFSAKEAVRFLRFRQVLADLPPRAGSAEANKTDWLALLDRHGYYDQSHLIHDFTHFLRLSPTKAAEQLLATDTICVTQSELLTGR